MRISSSIHLPVNNIISFFFMASVVGYLDYFRKLAIMKSAAINMGVEVVYHILACIPSGICPTYKHRLSLPE
jgi:hypothetical protein